MTIADLLASPQTLTTINKELERSSKWLTANITDINGKQRNELHSSYFLICLKPICNLSTLQIINSWDRHHRIPWCVCIWIKTWY